MKNFTKAAAITVIITFFIGLPVLQAQELKPKFGFRMAPNVGWMRPDDSSYESDGALLGFSWGFITEIPAADNYSFSTGFNIIFNGGKLRYPHQMAGLGEGLLERKYNLKYLEFPFMLRLHTSDRGGPIFFGQIGLGAGILLDARGTDRFSGEEFLKEKISDEIKLLRTSLIVGLGIEYPLGHSLKAIAGISLNNGFSDVLKGSNTVNSSASHKAFSNFIELNVGILF